MEWFYKEKDNEKNNFQLVNQVSNEGKM